MNSAIEALKKLREDFCLTALELSQGIGTSERNIWRWINGGNNPSPQAVESIEKFVYSIRKAFVEKEKKEIEKSSDLILAMIYDGQDYEFSADPKPGMREASITATKGRLRKILSFEKSIEIKALETLARAGKIQILKIELDRRLSHNSVKFFLDLGVGRRDQPSLNLTPQRLFKDKPIPAEAIKEAQEKGFLILNVVERIRSMRLQKEKSLQAHFGKVSDIESRLHREAIEDESAVRIQQKELIETLKPGGKKMRSDEYVEIKTLEKVKEIIEIKRTNQTLSPQIFYNHDGSKLILEPGESGIQTKMELIKKPKVEKKVIKK